jgi:hypothetical protein
LCVVAALANLPSYDVYNLRRSLRELHIPINGCGELRLSDEKNRELTHYMTRFTMPLLKHIYGVEEHGVTRFEDLVALFKESDAKKALERLKLMAQKLDVPLKGIPQFIEDYGDVFLSLSYYQGCLDRLAPLLGTFTHSMRDVRGSYQVRHDARLIGEIDKIEHQIGGLLAYLKRAFKDFSIKSEVMWENLSGAKFRAVQVYIQEAQACVGTVLCGLTVKLNAWVSRFPTPTAGSPVARAEFIASDMRQGLAEIVAMIKQGIGRGTAHPPAAAH